MPQDTIKTEQVSVGYGAHVVVADMDIAIRAGELVTLIGKNGVGKSTILKSMIRQLSLLGGTVYLNGSDMGDMPAKALAKKLSIVMTDRIRPERYTCYDVVASGRYPYTGGLGILQETDRRAITDAAGYVGAEELLKLDFDCISDGQRQRVMLARAICQEPEVLVLDEPTSYLDIRFKLEFLWMLRKLAREKKIAVLMSLHEIDLAQKISDRVICVRDGKIDRVGEPESVMTDDYICELYGMTQGVYRSESGSVEFPAADGDPRVFVIGGGGSGIPIYRRLQKDGIACAAGILQEHDVEYPVAKALCRAVVSTKAFSMPDETDIRVAKAWIDRMDAVYCPISSFGECNACNRELRAYAEMQNKLKNLQNSL